MGHNKNELFENIISSMSEGVMVFDRTGGIILANDRARQMLGLSAPVEEIHLNQLLLSGERYDEFVDVALEAVKDNQTRINRTISFELEGEEKRYILSTSYLKEKNGERDVLAVINDITEVEKLHETFGRYISDDIADVILNQPGGLSMGGMSREVTIMMSDLRGFTAMCQQMEAADLVAMLNVYFGRMYEMISRYHGTLIEFLGDGMLVVFGAPVPRENHAADAVAAAVAMQDAMKEVNEWNEEHGYPRLLMGIAINTGETVVGNIGCEQRTKYGVLGSQVNLAGRIESYTVAGQILISPSTREKIREELDIGLEADVSPKGIKGTLHLTQVTGIGGEYGISYEVVHETMTELPIPYVMTFRKLEGKHIKSEVLLGKLTAVSSEQVLIDTEEGLDLFENICMDIAGQTYGKVVKDTGQGKLVDLTAASPGYIIWLDEMRKNAFVH